MFIIKNQLNISKALNKLPFIYSELIYLLKKKINGFK